MSKPGLKYQKLNGTEEEILVRKTLKGEVVGINQIIRQGVSDKGRKVLNKSFKKGTNPATWDSEYREHIIYQIIYRLISPFKPKIADVARELGLDSNTIQSIIRTSQYQEIKSKLRKELRAKWGAEIDAVVIKKALLGSKYHAELYYKLEGELIDKLSVKHESDIPTDPTQRKELIKKYLHELGMDVGIMDKEAVNKFIGGLK